ncbi:MAG TPA: ATP-binding protein, partial [Gemmatimonadales bacterium]|nr:ATP-binding protein [Gemmatimonadales bacterium]
HLPPRRLEVRGDRVRLEQVFANLLNNAAKYTDPGGHVRLDVEDAGDTVKVRVRDDGIGIPRELLPRLFEMFSQAADARERAQGGLGIGLSLVRGLVEMHGGSVSADSGGPGAGSEFTVRLPLLRADVAPPPSAPRTAEPQAGRRRTIVVADDNVDAAESLAMVLRLRGHVVHTAHDGEGALALVRRTRPDVVLMDLGMPGLTGHEVACAIRQEPWGTGMTLVALTGWGQTEDRRRSQEVGFDHHLVKPVDFAQLERLLAPATVEDGAV